MQERKAPEQHPQHGVEGRAPHRAEAFVAMRKSEDRSLAVTTLHTTRHDNRAVARYNQIPGGRDQQKTDWTRKPQGTNRGGGQDEGGDAARRKRANPKQPQTTQEKRTEQQRETQPTPSKGQDTHATPQDNHGKTPKPNHNRRTRHRQHTTRRQAEYENAVHSKDRRPTRQPRRKVAKRQTKKGGVKQASRRKQKGGESIYVIRSVVCSRKCCLSDLRVVVQLFSRAKETGLLSS